MILFGWISAVWKIDMVLFTQSEKFNFKQRNPSHYIILKLKFTQIIIKTGTNLAIIRILVCWMVLDFDLLVEKKRNS